MTVQEDEEKASRDGEEKDIIPTALHTYQVPLEENRI